MITEIALSKDDPASPTWSTQFIFIPDRQADLVKLAKIFSSTDLGQMRAYINTRGAIDTIMSPPPGVEMTETNIMIMAHILRVMHDPNDEFKISARVRELSI